MNPSNPSPYRQTSAKSIRGNATSPDSAITATTPAESTKSSAYYLARRLQAVINDLGLLPHIPSGWLQPCPEGLSFGSLSVRQADRLVQAVEDVAQGYKPRRPSASPNQLSLFGDEA